MRNLIIVTIIILGAFCSLSPVRADVDEPVGLAAYTLKLKNFEWLTKSSKHFRCHYLSDSKAEREIDSLIIRNEASLLSHLNILEVEKYNKIIYIFYFDTREQINDVVMKPFRALADAESMTVLAVRNSEEDARDAHEIMHVVSFDLWGGWERRNELAWLGEGIATYADMPCNGYEMSELAAHILKNTDDSSPLDSLAQEFRKYPEMIGYMLMESFVEFVLENYGIEYLRNLWLEGYDGFEKVFGKDVATIEQEWLDYMNNEYPNPDVPDWNDLKEHGCK